MIRSTSIQQALSLRGTIPELAVMRSLQFMGDGYSPEEHGHIIVIQEGDDINHIIELDDCEYIETFVDADRIVYDAVLQIDNSKTIAVIIPDESWLDTDLRKVLISASPPSIPLPQIKEVMP